MKIKKKKIQRSNMFAQKKQSVAMLKTQVQNINLLSSTKTKKNKAKVIKFL